MKCPSCGKSIDNRSMHCSSCATKGERNPFWGRKHSAETRQKMVVAWERRRPLCECGCGQRVARMKNRFISGHNARLMVGEKHSGGMTGKHHSKETKLKMSAVHKGRTPSVETRRKLSEAMLGEKNPNYGKPRSIGTRRKMSLAAKGRTFSPETRRKLSIALSGPNSPNWRGGISSYGPGFSHVLKYEIRKRDNFTCQFPDCSKREKDTGRALDVHHIDYNKKNHAPNNLIALCNPCNCKANKDRIFWEEFFMSKVGGETVR